MVSAWSRLISVLLSLMLTVASSIGVSIGNNGESSIKPIRVQYGRSSKEFYEYYLPKKLTGVKNIVFMIHGGAWMTGNGSDFDDDCVAAAEAGYIAVNMDYRKIQDLATAKTMVKGIGDAVTSLKAELTKKNIKIGKMAMAGWSSGAHIMLLYAYQSYKTSPIKIAFLVANSPPTDFLYDAKTANTFMGEFAYTLMTTLTGEIILPGMENYHMDAIKAISPIYMVEPGVPPTILVHGDDDDVVPLQNSAELYKRLRAAGVDTVRILYEGAGHFLGKRFTEGNSQRTAAFNSFAKKYF